MNNFIGLGSQLARTRAIYGFHCIAFSCVPRTITLGKKQKMSSAAYKKQLKKGVTSDDGRNRRQQTTVALRKEKREEGLQKRRNLAAPEPAADDGAPNAAAELKLENLPIYCAGECALRSICW